MFGNNRFRQIKRYIFLPRSWYENDSLIHVLCASSQLWGLHGDAVLVVLLLPNCPAQARLPPCFHVGVLVVRPSGPSQMTAGVAVPPERPAQRTHLDSGNGGSRDGGGKNGVGGGSSTGRDNDLRCRWRSPSPLLSLWGGDCGHGRDDDNGGQKGGARRWQGDGKATARRGEYKATTRRVQGNDKASTRQRRGNKDAKAIGYGAAGGRDNKAINKRKQIIDKYSTNNNQTLTHLFCLISA